MHPLLVMLRCGGFNLNEPKSSTTIERIYSTICFSLYAVAIFFNFFFAFSNSIKLKWSIAKINILIDSFNFSIIYLFTMNTALFVLSWNGMADMWKVLHKLEESYDFDCRFYRTIRKRSWMAVFYIICQVISILFHAI